MNLDFLVKIMFYGFKTIFEILWKKKILLVKSPQKIELKNLRFLTDEIWSFLHHKSANDHS